MLDADRKVLAASRRARQSLEGVVVGELLPERLLEASEGRDPLEIEYEVDGVAETLVYLGTPGDLAAYQELRAGFTAAVSHESCAPPRTVDILLDSLALPGADADALAAQARAEVEQIGELIDDVLFLSEPRKRPRRRLARIDFLALPVLEEIVAHAPSARPTPASRCTSTAPPSSRCRCDRGCWRRSPPISSTTPATRVQVQRSRFARTRRVTRSYSSGEQRHGVPYEDLPRLFERFFRSDRARSSHGTGLGLAIVKHIVTSAGGTAEARAVPGGGLEIRVFRQL